MRWLLLAVGCTPAEGDDLPRPPADTLSDADTDADSDTDTDSDSDTDADTDVPVDHTGAYTGVMDLIVAELTRTSEAYAVCTDAAFTLDIDTAGLVTGGGGCTTPAPLEDKAFVAVLTGTVVDDELEGTMTAAWPTLPAATEDTWGGTFPDAATIDGHFEGHWTDGTLTIDWGAEFVLVRK